MIWFGYDLANPKDLTKLIKKIEKLVRESPEYKFWVKKCRAGYTTCPLCKTHSEIDPPEVHHEPLTLYEIVEDVLNKHIDVDIENLLPIDIVKEVIQLHLNNKVGYKVICSSCHERIHNLRRLDEKLKVVRRSNNNNSSRKNR